MEESKIRKDERNKIEKNILLIKSANHGKLSLCSSKDKMRLFYQGAIVALTDVLVSLEDEHNFL